MVTTIFLDESSKKINKEYLLYLRELELLSYLKKKKYIDIEKYNKLKIELKKSHIGK